MLTLAAFAAFAVVLVPSGSAKPPASSVKLYDVCLQGGTTACIDWSTGGGSISTVSGTNAQVTFNVKNESGSNTTLGSLNLNMPTGVTLQAVGDPFASTSTGAQLQLRNLNLAPGASHAVTFTVTAPNVCGTLQWSVAAKQSNDFNGSGNDFQLKQSSGLTSLITTGCHLAWLHQPASADQSIPITDTAFTPSGNSVGVAIEDGSNHPINLSTGTATLSMVTGSFDDCGTGCTPSFTGVTSTFVNGVATFTNFKSDFTGTGFTMQASALGLQTDASSPSFVIEPNGKNCIGLDPCDLSGAAGNGLVDIQGSGGNFVYLALGSASVPSEVLLPGGGCTNFTGTGTDFRETDARDGSGNLTVTLSITNQGLKNAYGPNYGQPNVPICVGVKYLFGNTAYPCNDSTNPGFAWADRTLAAPGSTFQGGYDVAKCDTTVGSAGYGYWWGIVGTFQDPDPPFDPAAIPLITGWGSVGNFRTFTINVPSDWDMQGHG
jgi:hypothetical protein